jgi:hypothetical protein
VRSEVAIDLEPTDGKHVIVATVYTRLHDSQIPANAPNQHQQTSLNNPHRGYVCLVLCVPARGPVLCVHV